MKHHACIAIGINYYQHLQPLRYAGADAIALFRFFRDTLNVPEDRCLLLGETAPTVEQRSTYPTRENLIAWLEWFCSDRVASDDCLWLFFSGYGVSDGEEDYLMPVEGDPQRMAETGISARSLFSQLQVAPAHSVRVVLDINRSTGSYRDRGVGRAIARWAREMEIPTLLSCQPEEFSRETMALGQGFFTAALLEGWRDWDGLTLERLERFLRDRLQELGEHHWRPGQHPAVVVYPPERMRSLVFPEAPPPATTPESEPEPNSVPDPTEFPTPAAPLWQRLSFAGGAIAAVIIFGILLGLEATSSKQQPPSEVPETPETSESPQPESPASQVPLSVVPASPAPAASSEVTFDEAMRPIGSVQATQFARAIASMEQIAPGDPRYPEAQARIERWSETILEIGRSRQEQGNVEGAIAAAQLVPRQTPDLYREAQTAIAQWEEQQPANDSEILQAARNKIKSGQASSYWRAIAMAKRIQPGQPNYPQAQQAIEGWSQEILKIAQTRARKGQTQSAIAAAELVPPETAAHSDAQKTIAALNQ